MAQLTATEWLKTISEKDIASRDAAILQAVANRNYPDFLNNFVDITISDDKNTLTYSVAPDVFSIGISTDFVRVPMLPKTAQKIANQLGCVIGTRKMVEDTWKNATIKATPIPGSPPFDSSMGWTSKFVDHNNKIQAQLNSNADYHQNILVSGIKKDIVICKSLVANSRNVAIFGWYYPTGKYIQPLNAVSHSCYYLDYSHSLRLVSNNITLNSNPTTFVSVMNDPATAYLLSDEGCFDVSRIYS